MDKRFLKRLKAALSPRLRKHHEKTETKFRRPGSSVDAFLDDVASTPGAASNRSLLTSSKLELIKTGSSVVFAPLFILEGLAIAAVQDGARAVRRLMNRKKRKLELEKRRTYYAAEAARRQEQRDQIEAARPAPESGCPTPEELTEAYLHRRDNEECKVRFGTLMIDLEEHERRVWSKNGNSVTGLTGGVKEWLKQNCPLLAEHYATCQRYKRMMQDDPRLGGDSEP